MVPQPDDSDLCRTRTALGAAVYFSTAMAEAGDDLHVYIEFREALV